MRMPRLINSRLACCDTLTERRCKPNVPAVFLIVASLWKSKDMDGLDMSDGFSLGLSF